jgi:hypothetical protein
MKDHKGFCLRQKEGTQIFMMIKISYDLSYQILTIIKICVLFLPPAANPPQAGSYKFVPLRVLRGFVVTHKFPKEGTE